MKKLVLLMLLEFICFSTFAQINRPKVVVGIVVDWIGETREPVPSEQGNAPCRATLHNELEFSIGIVCPDAAPVSRRKRINHWRPGSVDLGAVSNARHAARGGLKCDIIGGVDHRIAEG